MRSGHAHRYQCLGDAQHEYGLCLGIGGVRVDRAVTAQMLEAVAGHAVEAALRAVQQAAQADSDLRQSLTHELEQARYEASLAARRYEAVDPNKRLVARELESRWNVALEGVAELEARIARIDAATTARPQIDRAGLLALAHDLPAAWNAPSTNPRTKQRLTRILIQEVVIDVKDDAKEAVVTIHWTGGRHTEVRVSRIRTGRYPDDRHPSPVEVIRSLRGGCRTASHRVEQNRSQ
jgi:hypothetical protein